MTSGFILLTCRVNIAFSEIPDNDHITKFPEVFVSPKFYLSFDEYSKKSKKLQEFPQ